MPQGAIDYGALAKEHGGSIVPPIASAPIENPTHIGPDVGGIFSPDPNAISFADFIADPKAAIKKMVAYQIHELSNPRVSIPLAVGAALGVARGLGVGSGALPEPEGPAAAPASSPSMGSSIVQAMKQNPDAAIDLLPLGRKVSAGVKLARAVAQLRQPAAASEPPAPAEVPAASVPTAATPPAPASPPAARTAPAPTTSPAAMSGEFPSLDELHLTPAEITTAVKWHEQGVSPETILHRILQSRQLTSRTRTETPDQAAEAIRERNRTGKWRE